MPPADGPRGRDLPAPERAALCLEARALDAVLERQGAAARPLVEDVLARARSQQDPEALAWALRALAVVHRYEDDPPGAVRLLNRSVRVARTHGLAEVEAWALGSRASVELVRGRTARARADAGTALRLVGTVDGTPEDLGELTSRLQLLLAVSDHNAGRLADAEASYRELLRQVPPGSTNEVRGANNLALVLAARGEFTEALERAEHAVAVASRLSPLVQPWPFLTRALIEVRTGRLGDGLRDLERAAESCEQAGLSPGECYLEYADTMRELRLLPEAVGAGERAVRELQRAGEGLVVAEARVALAETLLMAGDLDAAVEAAQAGRRAARAQGRRTIHDRAVVVTVQARSRSGLADASDLAAVRRAAGRLEAAGQTAEATAAYLVAGRVGIEHRARRAAADLRAASRVARRGALPVRVRGRVAAALVARLEGADDDVLTQCRAGLRDLARHRGTLPTMELRALASGHGADLGELGLEVLLRRGTPAAALRWMERTRAAALLTKVVPAATSRARSADRADVPTTGRAERVDAAGAAPRTRRPVLADDDERAAEDRRSAWLEHVAVPDPAGGPRALSVPLLRRALDGRVLVEYGRVGDRFAAVVVGSTGVRVVDLGDVATDVATSVRALVFALRRLVDPRSQAAAEAARTSADLRLAQLREALVAPLGLPDGAELVVVPVGPLYGVPWSALHDGPVALAPSATAWLRTVGGRPADGRESVVLVAGPRLQGAQDEVDALGALHPAALTLGQHDSRSEVVVGAIATAGLAHLACHGALRSDNPMFSSVELADGPLTVQGLHRSGVAPRRLVLASCHSGADVAYEGDEVLGLVSAMLSQGTAGVVASIAAVPDVEVVDLMVGLHRRLVAGQTMSHALHGARGEIDRDTPAGFVNWCTFAAHGAA